MAAELADPITGRTECDALSLALCTTSASSWAPVTTPPAAISTSYLAADSASLAHLMAPVTLMECPIDPILVLRLSALTGSIMFWWPIRMPWRPPNRCPL